MMALDLDICSVNCDGHVKEMNRNKLRSRLYIHVIMMDGVAPFVLCRIYIENKIMPARRSLGFGMNGKPS